MRRKPLSPARKCQYCGKTILRREGQTPSDYRKLKTCGARECAYRGHNRGQAYTDVHLALLKKWYPTGGGKAVWENGWPYHEGGFKRQRHLINMFAQRTGIRCFNDSAPPPRMAGGGDIDPDEVERMKREIREQRQRALSPTVLARG
jgi:hypothetical protein